MPTDRLSAALAAACLTAVLLPLLWPFLYATGPTSDECWMVAPYDFSDERGHGLNGYPPDLSGENDENFDSLYWLYVLAVATSATSANVLVWGTLGTEVR